MTDGTTGIQVAPITEDDMNRVQSILKRAADAIVGMSQLAADVDMLRQTVTRLQADADRLHNQNNALDEALNHSRAVRDEQAQKLAALSSQLHKAEADRIDAINERDTVGRTNDQLQIDLDMTRKAKDDAEFRVMELEDELAKAKAKLDKWAALSREVFSVEPVKPTPSMVVEPAPVPEPTPPAPEPVPPLAETRPDSLDEWEPGYIWDPHTRRYWREGVTTRPDGAAIPF